MLIKAGTIADNGYGGDFYFISTHTPVPHSMTLTINTCYDLTNDLIIQEQIKLKEKEKEMALARQKEQEKANAEAHRRKEREEEQKKAMQEKAQQEKKAAMEKEAALQERLRRENEERIKREKEEARKRQSQQDQRVVQEGALMAGGIIGAMSIFAMDNESKSNKYRGLSFKFSLPFEINCFSLPVNVTRTTHFIESNFDSESTSVSGEIMPGLFAQPEFYLLHCRMFSIGGYGGLGFEILPGTSQMTHYKYGLKVQAGFPFMQFTLDEGTDTRTGFVNSYHYNESLGIEMTTTGNIDTKHDYLIYGIRFVFGNRNNAKIERPFYWDINISREKFMDDGNDLQLKTTVYSMGFAKSNKFYMKVSYAPNYPAAAFPYKSEEDFKNGDSKKPFVSVSIGKYFEWFGKAYFRKS